MSTIARDGVRLAYDESGRGDAAAVLIHGWCCDRTHLRAQAEHLADRFRTVRIDLRGHGESDAPEQPYSISGFADDIVWLCGELGIEQPLVIGHSMGGVITLELASRGSARAAVLLDPAVFLPVEAIAPVRALAEAFRVSPDALRGFWEAQFFGPHDDARRREELLAAAGRMPGHVAGPAFASILDYDCASAAARCTAPMLGIWATWPPLSDVARFRELCPQLGVAFTTGSGHFHQMEVPDQVNALIDRFLANEGVA